MPEMIPLGWFHTLMGVTALVSGIFTLATFKEIRLQNRSGQVYLATTLLTAGTALAIFQRGEFGPGHALAVMTLLALAVGTIAATTKTFGKMSRLLTRRRFSFTASPQSQTDCCACRLATPFYRQSKIPF